MEHWDPIGVQREITAQDEYDSYLPEIVRLLDGGTTTGQLAARLSDIASLEMGLVKVEQRDRFVAEQLLRLLPED